MSDPTLNAKLKRMRDFLRTLRRVAVAFSGGVDSTFVLMVAADTLGPENVVAVIGNSTSLPRRELREAEHLARSMNVRCRLVDPGEFTDPQYLANPPNRCYFCKDALYARMAEVLAADGFHAIVNGTNADDLGDYRPGHAAAAEHAVHSPCVEAGLTKADIRTLSVEMGLPTADKPAAPCLSSRVQYGEAITPEKLAMIEHAESFLRDLGFRECRVRHHGDLARIEVPADRIESLAADEMRARIEAAFREVGYQYVTIDLRGFRSGSMNEVIAFGRRQASR
ncbi:MAG: ATP-dependent sacrificial sulfur transferase LarE [Phycisphaerae bacterium]